jgi:HK97 gp10 family phage protein
MAGAEVKWYGNERLKEISAQLKSGMAKACLLVERDAKTNAPVDTGRLRASITNRIETEEGQLVGIVGTNVVYASYQEFGTYKMPAHPFLFPALESNRDKIKDLLKDK